MTKRDISIALTLVLTLLYINSIAQPEPPSPKTKNTRKGEGVEQLKKLGKDSLVKMGLAILKRQGFDVYDYQTKVIANRNFLIIDFRHPVKYLPQNTIYAGSHRLVFSSNKFQKRMSFPYRNSLNVLLRPRKIYPAYRQTAEGKEVIQKVVNSINRFNLGSTPKIDLKAFKGEFTVRDKDAYYAVEMTANRENSSFRIDKSSGKILKVDVLPLPPPPPSSHQDEYKEIKH
ncbi:hypothetical protein BKI52_03675 [marine bacterium AO1-C]|nr:hypothetical protein BKI52_03675 [marine bacterium AO1-C]